MTSVNASFPYFVPQRGHLANRLFTGRATIALGWLGLLACLAVFAPLIANGHPLMVRELDLSGRVTRTAFPLLTFLSPLDLALMALVACGALSLVVRPSKGWGGFAVCGMAAVAVAIAGEAGGWWASKVVVVVLIGAISLCRSLGRGRLIYTIAGGAVGIAGVALTARQPLEVFDYAARQSRGEIRATHTLIPHSPNQRFPSHDRVPPLTSLESANSGRDTFVLGTDGLGQDVLSQLLWSSRLAITIGLVSAGIASVIGIAIGAIMGYFGGWVDLLLFRMVEVFMAVPLLFLLIVAAGVLPAPLRTTHAMMAIIGCFTWMGTARFTRAEFLKLRNQDFVQSARASGLPLSSVLFRHMLPNGVAPAIVDASFAVAAAIAIEATLSYLGLGPVDQPSWGRLLAGAVNSGGRFNWWLAVFPGGMVFLTILSYHVLGETLRDAIDPKLRHTAGLDTTTHP